MTGGVRLRAGGRDLADEAFDAVCALHDEVFAEPPFAWGPDTAAGNVADLERLRGDPTFRLLLAEDAGRPVGYAYGHRLPVDHGWWGDFPEPLPPDLTAEWEGRTFALVSLALRAPWRGRGTGARIVRGLLAGRDEERAVLSVQPAATATQAFYRHLGWRPVGRKGPLAGVTPPYWDIYLLSPLPGRDAAHG
ncbi:GNAT family N-acetyltransferase [Actinomadura parmotrematis]|uniref:GNAT family N-acetyltransferase n=1 Tax=Actinomadura parmotrematis TaxID=2864039 RepID=A0ABS7FYN6_9ACTN|nr:GNAT family N-acetyltransferase [Actinomadura parmotrematis]MBW8485553.1 GNAT family N-acetyltransferase [Actinomadura parmotrematis]